MITFSRFFSSVLILVALSIATVNSQSPKPIIVQAAIPSAPASTTPTPITPVSDSTVAAIRLLQEIKAANEETLKKQQSALEQLDELQKAAEQIKIFANRG
jgi:hypothetical protein